MSPVVSRMSSPGAAGRSAIRPLSTTTSPTASPMTSSPYSRRTLRPMALVIDPVAYHREELTRNLAGERGRLAAVASEGRRPLALRVGDRAWTYRSGAGGVEVEEGVAPDAATVAVLSPDAWSDLA